VLGDECDRTEKAAFVSPVKSPLLSHSDSTWAMRTDIVLDSFLGARLRAVAWKSSDVLVLNRPSKCYGNWLQLSGATCTKTC